MGAARCSRTAAEVPMQALERAEGGGIPCGGVLDVVAWQPDLLSRACKGAQEGNKPGVGRVGGSVACNHVVGDTEAALRATHGAACQPKPGLAGSTSCMLPWSLS